ncbi:histidine phosphatase family protein [Bacteroidota bacterium]
MKILYLFRHAKSSWKNPDLDDIDRPLNKRGKRDAPFIGQLLKKSNIKPDILMSSSANRALSTAKTIAKEIGYPIQDIVEDVEIYEASTNELLQIIKNIEDKHDRAMIFGHNPTFTLLSNQLTDTYIDNISTCSFVKIEFNVESWKDIQAESGKLLSFEYPKKYLN